MASKADRDREWRKAQARLVALLTEGKADEEVQAELGFSPEKYWRCKRAAFEAEAERIRATPTEHTYVQYCLDQAACIKDLTDLIDDAKKTKNANACVGAIRARSDIFDKVIKTGQEFGILEKKPEEKRIVAGVMVAQLTNDQLRQAITTEISRLNQLVVTYGELPMADLDPGALYYDAPETPSKTNKAIANKVHGGRRRVVK